MEKSQEVWVMLDHQKKNRTTFITEDIFKQRTASKQAVFPTCLPQAPVQQEIHTQLIKKKSHPIKDSALITEKTEYMEVLI